MEVLSDLLNTMEELSPLLLYGIIVAISYGENILPPIPGDLVVVYGGYLAGIGRLSLGLVVVLSTVAGALGFMTMYAIGWRMGAAVLDEHRLRWLPKRYIARAHAWIQRWGYGLVLANRFLSGTRSVISLAVGMARMEAGRTFLFCTLSALAWVGLIAYLGYALGENYDLVVGYLRLYGRVILAATLLFVLMVLLRRRRRARESNDSETMNNGARKKESVD